MSEQAARKILRWDSQHVKRTLRGERDADFLRLCLAVERSRKSCRKGVCTYLRARLRDLQP